MNQLKMPDPERVRQSLARSQERRRELEIAGLELDEIIALLEQSNRQRYLRRLRDRGNVTT
jgi:hypothetical protein